jgi:hypothetical protein
MYSGIFDLVKVLQNFNTCIDSYTHHDNQGTEYFHDLKHFPVSLYITLYLSQL